MVNREIVTSLSDSALLGELERLSKEENETTVQVLLHLAEVEERKLYLSAGYATMFAYCTQKLRDKVHVRDGGRCTFVSADGARCSETHDVEVHHVQAFGRGGGHEAGNLRLLCRRHNVYEAEREFGQAHMARCVR